MIYFSLHLLISNYSFFIAISLYGDRKRKMRTLSPYQDTTYSSTNQIACNTIINKVRFIVKNTCSITPIRL